MKVFLFACVFCATVGYNTFGQTPVDKIGESTHFEFYSNFWMNMHHFVYANAFSISRNDSLWTRYRQIYQVMVDDEQETLMQAINYYTQYLLDRDLLFDDDLYQLKRWLILQTGKNQLMHAPVLTDYIELLNKLAPVYQKYFWEMHHACNQKVFAEEQELLRKTEVSVSRRLSKLSQMPWQKKKIRVDICYHSKLNRPYTTVRPEVHIVMDSNNNHHPEGNWIELIYHEASHHLILGKQGAVGEIILKLSQDTAYTPPPYLWHAVLFYIAGQVTKDALKKFGVAYELYMIRKRVFVRDHRQLAKYLDPYLVGTQDLPTSLKALVHSYKAK